jgi:hypothetical protein
MVVEGRSRPVCLDLGLAGLAGLLDLWVRGCEHGLPLPPGPIVAGGAAWSGPVALFCGPARSCLEELYWASDCFGVVMADVLAPLWDWVPRPAHARRGRQYAPCCSCRKWQLFSLQPSWLHWYRD